MKTKLMIFLAVILLFAAGTKYVTQETTHQSYVVLRAEADEDTAIDLTSAGDFASKPSLAIWLKPNEFGSGIENQLIITVIGGDAANDIFSWRLYAWRRANGPAELVAYGTGILGTQAVVKYPHSSATATNKFWADSFVIIAQYWPKTVTATPIGGNSVGKLKLDGTGAEWWLLEITDADGATGIEAGDLTGYYSYY